jgi:hypothetical protein
VTVLLVLCVGYARGENESQYGCLYGGQGHPRRDDGLPREDVRLEGKEEPASKEMKPEVAHEEILREDAAVMPVRGLRKRRRGRKQALR